MLKTICLALKLCSTVSGHAIVIDGDSVVVENVHVRLMGIDAEEINEPMGIYAKRGLMILVHGQTITCKLNGEKSYNRYIGTCYTDNGIDIAADAVRFGYALDCKHYSNGKYRSLEPTTSRTFLSQKPYC